MSKDLEKEYLEDLDHYDEGMGIHSTSYQKCKERLIRLARIDNAEPSEALESFDYIVRNLEAVVDDVVYMDCIEHLTTIKQALIQAEQDRKAIEKGKNTDIIDNYMAFKNDNANPSEALKELDKIIEHLKIGWTEGKYLDLDICFNNIKATLLKSQEPKKYLKWEDLEKDRTYKVLLNGIQYELVKRYDDYEYRCDYITLQKEPNISIYIYEYEKEIFNDLHLERVEE